MNIIFKEIEEIVAWVYLRHNERKHFLVFSVQYARSSDNSTGTELNFIKLSK